MIDKLINESEVVYELISNSLCNKEIEEEFHNIVNDFIEKSKNFEVSNKKIETRLKSLKFQLLTILQSIKPFLKNSFINYNDIIQTHLNQLKKIHEQLLILLGQVEE